MSYSRFGIGFIALGAFGGTLLSSGSAEAVNCCIQNCTYHPARYTSASAGDVALIQAGNPPTPQQVWMAPMAQALDLTYLHTKLLYDSTGSAFTETFPDVAPPGSYYTGEPHWCSRPISPFYLQRLSPGAGTYFEDAQVPGELVKGFGKAGCVVPADGYHINSFINDNVPGGSCEKLLVDYCGVPVEYNTTAGGDRQIYSGPQALTALTAAFQLGYQNCMGTQNSLSSVKQWWEQYVECGGTSQQTMCERAGWQIVNEMLYKAYPEEYVGLGAGAGPDGYMDGWSDFNVAGPAPVIGSYPPPNYNTWTGTMLGAGKSNAEVMPNGALCPGALTGNSNNFPLPCSAYEPTAWTANVPDNIARAAKRLGKTIVSVTSTSGYAAGYQTCTNVPEQNLCTPYAEYCNQSTCQCID